MSTKRTRHINIRYFYVTNKIKSGDVVIVYHPIDRIVGDFLTKLLYRTPFKNHHNTIVGVTEDTIEYYKMKYENARVGYRKRIGS